MTDRIEELLSGESPSLPQAKSDRVNQFLEGEGLIIIESPLPGEKGQPRQLQTEAEPTGAISTITGKPMMKPIARPEATAGFGTMVETGIVEDLQTKIKIFAQRRGISPDRYGVVGGEIVYLADDGVLYYEAPQTGLGKLKGFGAGMVSHAPEIVLGTAMAPAGPLAAGLGAAGGAGIRKGIGALAYGEPQTTLENIKQMGLAAGEAIVGEKIGGKVVRGIDVSKGRKGARLVKAAGRGRERISLPETVEMERLGQQYGIELLPPQTTRSPELISRFNILADLPETAETIGKVRRAQYEQTVTSIMDYLDSLAPADVTARTAGEDIVALAKQAERHVTKGRSNLVKKLYDEAKKVEGIDLSKTMEQIDSLLEETPVGSAEQRAIANVKRMLMREAPIEEPIQKIAEPEISKGVQKTILEDLAKEKSFRSFVRSIGGLNPSDPGWRGEIKDISRGAKWQVGVLRKKGHSMDEIVAHAKEYGWDIKDGNDVLEALATNRGKSTGLVEQLGEWFAEQRGKYERPPDIEISKGVHLVPEDRLKIIDKVKKNINAAWKRDPANAPEKETQRELNKILNTMLKEVDEVSKSYKKARAIYAKLSPLVERRVGRKTQIGRLARIEGDKVESVARELFAPGRSSPEMVKRSKEMILKEGGQEAWDAILRVHVQNALDSVKETVTGRVTNLGGRFRQKLFGDPQQRKIMQTAMSPIQYKNFDNFMKVLDRVGLILGQESTTATRQVALKQMHREAESKLLMAATRPLYTPHRILGDKVNELLFTRANERLAEAMTSKAAAKQLRSMLLLKPESQKLIKQLSTFVTMVLGGETYRGLEKSRYPEILPAMQGQQ